MLSLLAVILAASATCAFDESRWAALMDRGAYNIARNSDSTAKKLLEEALKLSDENTPLANHAREQTLVKLGKLCERQRNLYEADQCFKKAFSTLQRLNADAEPTLLIEYYERTGRHFFAEQMKQYYERQIKNPPNPQNLTAYMQTLQERLKKVWVVPKVASPAEVVCLWCAHSSGTISLLHLDESSGDAVLDNSALDAIRRCIPLPQLPPGSPDNTYIQYTFECKPRPQAGK
jgi:TonB family protein